MAVLTVLKPYNATASPPGAGCISIGGAQTPNAGGDTMPNDGKTIFRWTNTDAATRTVTIAPYTAAVNPFVTFKTWAFVIPATNGDIVTRTFEPAIYNNPTTGELSITYSAVTNLLVYCISAGG